MAVGNKGDLDLRASIKTLKGFYVRSWLGRYVISKSPSQPKTPNRNKIWNQNQFAIAARMAASPLWLDQISAMQVSKGTEQVPRDILMMAAYGKLISIEFPDGTVSTVADHNAPPLPAPRENKTMLIWGALHNARSTAYDSYPAACKGMVVNPLIPMKLRSVDVIMKLVLSAPYRMIACETDASFKMTRLIAVQNVISDQDGQGVLHFPMEMDLPTDRPTTFLVARTDVAGNHVLPIWIGFDNAWLGPFGNSQILVFNNVGPGVGSIGIPGAGSGQMPFGLQVEY